MTPPRPLAEGAATERQEGVTLEDVMLTHLIVAVGCWGKMVLLPIKETYRPGATNPWEQGPEREVGMALVNRWVAIFDEVADSLLRQQRYLPKIAIRVLLESTDRLVYHDLMRERDDYDPLVLIDTSEHKALNISEIRKRLNDELMVDKKLVGLRTAAMRDWNAAVHAGKYKVVRESNDSFQRLNSIPPLDEGGQAAYGLLVAGFSLLKPIVEANRQATLHLEELRINLGRALDVLLEARGINIARQP